MALENKNNYKSNKNEAILYFFTDEKKLNQTFEKYRHSGNR